MITIDVTMPENTPEKALKIKSLLQSYYAETEGDSRDSIVTSSGNETTAFQPSHSVRSLRFEGERENKELFRSLDDDAHFDAAKTAARLIRERRLTTLIEDHGHLVAEAATLDSDMQNVVYENYSKFVEAGDTISHMGRDMEGLDDKLRNLDALIGTVVERSESINGRLEVRQSAIDSLTNSRESLEQLQELLTVPQRLRIALERKAFDVFSDTYEVASPALKALGNRKALHSATTQVAQRRNEAVALLREKLNKEPDQAGEIVPLLAKLEEPTGSLFDDYLTCQQVRMSNIMDTAEEDVAQGPHPVTEEEVTSFMDDLNFKFIVELNRTALETVKLFGQECKPQFLVEGRSLFFRYLDVIRKFAENVSTAEVLKALQLDADGLPVSTTGSQINVFDRDSLIVEESDWGFATLQLVLNRLSNNVTYLETSLPELSVRDKISETRSDIARKHIASCFSGVKARIIVDTRTAAESLLDTRSSDASLPRTSLAQSVAKILSSAQIIFQACLAVISNWQSSEWIVDGWRETFVSVAQSQATNFLHTLVQRLEDLTSSTGRSDGSLDAKRSKDQKQRIESFLSMSKLQSWKTMSTTAADFPWNILLITTLCAATPRVLGWDVSIWLEENVSDDRNTVGIFALENTSQDAVVSKLFERFRSKIAGLLSEKLVLYLEDNDWQNQAPPKSPGPVYVDFVEQLRGVDGALLATEEKLMAALPFPKEYEKTGYGRGNGEVPLDRKSVPHVRHESSTSAESFPGKTGTLKEEYGTNEVIDDQRSTVQRLLPWKSRGAVIAPLVASALRKEIGIVRTKILSRGAFQQVQLDCHYLRDALENIIGISSETEEFIEVAAAIDELVVAAAERCAEGPTLLEPNVLDRMIKQ